jgi:endonuclease/exonuclease/phosphatase family metal-dependent hydrolase
MRALRVGGRADATRSELAAYEEGTWGLAVLSRARILTTEALELGRLKRDFTHRSALAVRLCVGSPHSGGLPPVSLSPASLSPASLSEAGPPGASRPAAREEVEADFTVVGMHAAHLSHGSPIQLRRLASQLPPTYTPAAIAGDLNLWGPPVSIMLPGWTRAVRGRTWPAWRPHSQPDHILVSRPVKVSAPEVIRTGNSDHRAVRAVLYW